MNSDEPALVPQWLQKGGPPGTSGGHNYSSTSQFASRDNKSRPKRDVLVTSGRPGSTAIRDSTFGRSEREAPRRDRALRDSWQTGSALGSSTSSSYRPAPASRGTRAPPDRLASDNGRANLDNRESFGAPNGSSSSRAVFRTQSGPPLRDREDFGFGSSTSGHHDSSAFKPAAPRGTPSRSSLDKPPFDRDFPSLAGRSNVGKSWHSGNALPEQQWTRLADAPDGSALSPRVPNPRLAESPLAESAKALPKQGSGPLDAPTALQARMVDTLQQASSQTSVQAPPASKARLEELVMRQSKQLIPVVASSSARDKAKGKGTASSGPKHSVLATPGAVSGTAAGVGRGKAGVDPAKRADDTSTGPVMTGLGPSLRRLPSGDPKVSQNSGADGRPEGGSDAGDSGDSVPAGSTKQLAPKDVERQRSSFFQSLRRTSAKTQDSDKAVPPSSPSTPPAQAASLVSPPDPPTNTLQPDTASPDGVSSNQQNGATPGSHVSNGHDHERRHSWDAADPRSKVSPEEEAFLRSLGWTEAGNDEDEALTEEEIAAFKANTQHLCIKSFRPTSQSFTGFSNFSPRPKVAAAAQNGVNRPSQLDTLSSSDSDSDYA